MKKIMICNISRYYTVKRIMMAFSELGHRVAVKNYFTPDDKYRDEKLEKMIAKDIDLEAPDFVFTVNYSPILSKVCHEKNVVYASWTYDTPMDLPGTDTMDNPNNYIFIFDHGEYVKYKNMGLDTVYYLPLASDFYRFFDSEFEKNAFENSPKYLYDVSFIGNLYKSTYPYLKDRLGQYNIGFTEGIMTAQREIYGCYFVLDMLKDKTREVQSINNETGLQLMPEQLSYSLAAYMTYLDRLSLLALISKRFKTALVTENITKEELNMMPELLVLSKMDYYSEMPLLFFNSRININPPFRAVWSAIPQRALDIMSSGGFLLSGYTAELAYYFENEKELVLYDSIEDAVSKADFYLKHDELRERIKKAGYEKVKSEFRYEDRIVSMTDIIDESR